MSIFIDSEHDLLLVIDVQPTFMPGGSLPVPHGDEVVPVINMLLSKFAHAVACQDWHPKDHLSFASQHPGLKPGDSVTMPYGEQMLWPDHGIAGTAEAELHPDLETSYLEDVFRKGMRRDVDSYSAFRENDKKTETGLAYWIRSRGFTRLFLCGLATDFCVKASALDAVELLGPSVSIVLVEDACRGVGFHVSMSNTVDIALAEMEHAGVQRVKAKDILPGSPGLSC
jgi:nicotinamidase/pyrazinamidase